MTNETAQGSLTNVHNVSAASISMNVNLNHDGGTTKLSELPATTKAQMPSATTQTTTFPPNISVDANIDGTNTNLTNQPVDIKKLIELLPYWTDLSTKLTVNTSASEIIVPYCGDVDVTEVPDTTTQKGTRLSLSV